MGEVKITYETLYDLARREKSSEDIQKLDSSFYPDTQNYIKEKKAVVSQTGLFSNANEAHSQLQNILKVIREIYERREKKILRMAIERVRTGSTIIDTTTLLPEEKVYYNDAVHFIAEHRQLILDPVVGSPTVIQPIIHAPLPQTASYPTSHSTSHEQEELAEQKISTKVRFTTQVPKFMDAEKNHHGPFNPGDEAAVPDYIAKILLNKGKAQNA